MPPLIKKGRIWTLASHAKLAKVWENMRIVPLKQIEMFEEIVAITYLFPLVRELAFSFDSTCTSSFSSNFLVGFRGFDSFQFRHLIVVGTVEERLCFLFSDKGKKSVCGIYLEESAIRRFLVLNKRTKKPVWSFKSVLPATEFVGYISCHYF